MADNTPDVREPDTAVRAVDRLVGTRISGDATGTVIYGYETTSIRQPAASL
jgi:hypothetical protein